MSNLKYRFDNHDSGKENIKLLYVTTSKDEGDWPSYMHSHYFTELFYVKSGAGSMLVNDESFPIEKNDLIIINPNLSHTEVSAPSEHLSYIAIGVEGMHFSFSDNKEYTKINCSSLKNNLTQYFSMMLSELENKLPNYQEVCTSLLNILIIQLTRMTGSPFEVMVSERSNKDIARIKKYIESNYQDPITLDSLAGLAHLNKFYMVHLFRETYGLSPINYLNECRIQASKELLKSTDHSISEVARLSGFSSQSYFAQSFKKNCHMSAGEFRRISKL